MTKYQHLSKCTMAFKLRRPTS